MKQAIFFTGLIFAFCLSISGQARISSDKVAVINSDRFFEGKTGIKEFIDTYSKVQEEQKLEQLTLNSLSTRIQALKKYIETIQNNPTVFQARLEELEKLQNEYEFRSKEISYLLEKRKIALMNSFKIREALMRFKKEKGYAIILDESRFDISSIIIEDNEFPARVTSEFVEFYNKNYVKTNLQ